VVLAVRAQSAWPGPGQQVFCIRERFLDPEEQLEELERAPVLSLGQVGRKVAVVLDRKVRKRCEFLVVAKQRRGGGPDYEQVFFRTESGIRAHRSRARVELPRGDAAELTVVIDSGERYAWRFPGSTVLRRRLAVGDYALLSDGRTIAVVERKSFDNLLGDIGAIQALHQVLADLAAQPAAAVVVEAEYGDFLDEGRLAGRWPAGHLARVLAEVQALHPALPIVYAGSRKLANAWCARYFGACAQRAAAPQLELVREVVAAYGEALAPPGGPTQVRPVATGGVESLDARLRRAALERGVVAFSLRELAAEFPGVAPGRVRRAVLELEEEGLLDRVGGGRGTRRIRRRP
jgi:hypothetical protein